MKDNEFGTVCLRAQYITILKRIAHENKRSIANQLEIILDKALELEVEA